MNKELNDLISSNQGLIYSIASKFKGDKEDLFQAGCIGLIDAYYKYDPRFNTKFTSYAYQFIYGEMYKYCINNKNIKLSSDLLKLYKAINKSYDYLSQKLGRVPTDLELSNFLEIPITKLQEARNYLSTESIDDNINNIINLDNISKDDLIMLRDALNKLNEKEKELIIKRYFYNQTQSDLANEFGTNQVKVSREENKILTKLRTYM